MTHWDSSSHAFASDNCAGVHPELLAAIEEANVGHQASYGADAYTHRLRELVRRIFGPAAQVFPVFNGTGANVLALEAMTARGEAVVCAEVAHLNTSEFSAPEHHGLKLLTVPTTAAQMTPDGLREVVMEAVDRHRAKPGVLSLTQSTELGTCYSRERQAAVVAAARELGLRVHLDGARLANAAAHSGLSLHELVDGIDVVSFGLTKNGGMFADCVVVLDPSAVRGLPILHKAVTQLPSKTRFISAQLLALLGSDLWLRNARAANAMAVRLAHGLRTAPGVRIAHEVQANAVFAAMPPHLIQRMRERYSFSTWQLEETFVRLMTAFDTEAKDVDAFVTFAKSAAEGASRGDRAL